MKLIGFEIEDKKVIYHDDFWFRGLQIYPLKQSLVNSLKASKSEKMRTYGLLIEEANSGKELEEYNLCQTDEDVAEVIRRDCKSRGLVET